MVVRSNKNVHMHAHTSDMQHIFLLAITGIDKFIKKHAVY